MAMTGWGKIEEAIDRQTKVLERIAIALERQNELLDKNNNGQVSDRSRM